MLQHNYSETFVGSSKYMESIKILNVLKMWAMFIDLDWPLNITSASVSHSVSNISERTTYQHT